MQRRGAGACYPRMPHLIDSAIFAAIALFVLVFGRADRTLPPDPRFWSDDTERRMLAGGRRDWP